MFFKGYVPTKNKKCMMTFKGKSSEELLNIEEARKLDEYAGILAEDTILIDIDDYDKEGKLKNGRPMSDVLLKMVEEQNLICRVYKANRGYHFLFKNKTVDKCYTDVNLACGIRADIKVGSRNSYEVLKYNKVERKIIYDKFDEEVYDQLPKWLEPVKSTYNFIDMGEGDGRNQSLFNYILTLQANGFMKEECREVLTLLNKYVLAKPLGENELSVIMRNDAFKKETFFADKTFLFEKFSNYLMSNAYIRRINNILHIYKDGYYINGSRYIEQEMIKNIPHLKAAYRTEVLKYLELIVPDTKMSDARYIAFNNGIYDIVDDTMIPFSPEFVITNKIPWDYIPGAYSEIADKTLNKLACNEKDVRMLLEEAIGYGFYRRNEMRKAFMLVGDKKNGKSTWLDMVCNVLGETNVATLDANEIGDRFLTAELNGMLANIGDDIDKKYVGNTGFLKKLIAGNKVQAQKKGKDPFKLAPYTKFYFSANNIPRFDDSTGALFDRFIIVPFKATFSPLDPDFDPYIKYKLEDKSVMEYLIAIAVEGLKRVLKNNDFTMPDTVKQELQQFNENNNPILLFFSEISVDEVVNHTTKDVYLRYDYWCGENGVKPYGAIQFGQHLTKHFNLTTKVKHIDGKSQRIYVE